MFCVLIAEKREKTLFERFFGGLRKDKYELKTVPVFKGAPFYLFTAEVGERGVDWEYIIKSVGKCSKRLVVNEGTKIPDLKGLGEFSSRMLYKKMMENTFLTVIKNNYSPKKPAHICLIDKNAQSTDLALKIAPYAFRLTVATDKKEKYGRACDEIIESTGLCPAVQFEMDEAKIKINADRSIMTVNTQEAFINITDGSGFTVPQMYCELFPQGIDKYDFYAALYEFCGVFSLGECIFDTVQVNREKMNVDDVHFS